MNRESLVVFERLMVGPVRLEPNRLKATYELTLLNGQVSTNELIYRYAEDVFRPHDARSINLASLIAAQIAVNYGLFCREIVFDGLFKNGDRRFILDMMENTSREIYVNKFLFHNEFLIPDYQHLPTEKRRPYTAAAVSFINTRYEDHSFQWTLFEPDHEACLILSSGGKDSLLTYGILRELGKKVHPVFINESGKHWFTAINAYRHFETHESNTARVWCNSDRIFTWMVRHMPFIRKNFATIRADIYPIRLWTVAIFVFGALPIALKRRIGRLVIGDEYDCTQKLNYRGITHYNSLYDQSKYFDNALTRLYLKKGWNLYQYSIIRCLSELLVEKILVERYPDLQKHQISCHAAHEKAGRIYPCGKCEKCRRIVGMLTALEKDPARCGYTPGQIKDSLTALEGKTVKQIGPDAAHLFQMLLDRGAIAENEHTRKLAKRHEEILYLRFDQERSNPADLPIDMRIPVFELFLQHARGALSSVHRRWQPADILKDDLFMIPYPFEFTPGNGFSSSRSDRNHPFLWELLTREEIEERLHYVDTAILPCGSIEQHGPHLPVDVDYYDIVYLARRVAEACSDPKPFVLPGIPYGVSYHHADFKGTLSVSNDALAAYVYDIGINLAKHGIKKLILLNGHGDNAPTLKFAAQKINRDARIFVCIDSGETSDTDINAMIETPNDVHAGEIETSTTLALRPELVKMDKARDCTLSFGSSYLDFTSARGVPWYVHTSKLSETGIMGNPTKANLEKGKKIWEVMIAQLVKFVEEVKSSNIEDLYQKRY